MYVQHLQIFTSLCSHRFKINRSALFLHPSSKKNVFCHAHFRSKVYKTTIPRSIRISEAPSYGQPINFYEPKGKGSEAYMDLAIEFVKNNRPHEPKKARRKSAPVAEQTKNALED